MIAVAELQRLVATPSTAGCDGAGGSTPWHRCEGEKQIAALERDATKIRREIDRLVGALAVTDDKPNVIVNGIAERQARLRDLDAKIIADKAAPQVVEDTLTRIVDASLDAIRRFQEIVRAHPDQAREVVAALFDKIVFTPVSTPDVLRATSQTTRVVDLASWRKT